MSQQRDRIDRITIGILHQRFMSGWLAKSRWRGSRRGGLKGKYAEAEAQFEKSIQIFRRYHVPIRGSEALHTRNGRLMRRVSLRRRMRETRTDGGGGAPPQKN